MSSYPLAIDKSASVLSGRRIIMLLRDFAFPFVALLLAYMVKSDYVVLAVIVGGQSHFFMAYLYQYRGKRMSRLYLLIAALILAAGICFFALVKDPFYTVFFIVCALFGTHFAIDELTLHDEGWTWERATTIIGFVSLFFVVHIYMVDTKLYLLPLVASVLVASGMLVRLIGKKWPGATERYLWYLSLILMFILVHPQGLYLGLVTMFIIMLHFLNWLVGYGIKVHGKPIEKRYWIESVATFGISAALGVLYMVSGNAYLGYFFSLMYYYYWSCTHVVLSFIASRTPRLA